MGRVKNLEYVKIGIAFGEICETVEMKYYSDKYFVRAGDILAADGHDPKVLMQVFCRAAGLLCGIEETLQLLRNVDSDLTIHGLSDGDPIAPWETVLTIEGSYAAFAHLETLYLGVLARGTRVATQTQTIVSAANGKSVLFFGARHDHYATQEADGYAALIAGASGIATDAQGSRQSLPGIGTVPHALIAAYGGDTVLASQKFVEFMPPEIPFIALVDFDNDCVNTSLAVAEALGARLAGVRLDTSNKLIDASLQNDPSPQTGVNPALVRNVRNGLDEAGYHSVEIVVSGGLTAERVKAFEDAGAPVDAYGVGSSILRNTGEFDFTADIVRVDGKPISKVGRALQTNDRLKLLAG